MAAPTDADRARGADATHPAVASSGYSSGLSLRVRLTAAFVAMAVVPLAIFGLVVVWTDLDRDDQLVSAALVLSMAGAALLGLVVADRVGAAVIAPLRRIATAVQRVAAGERSEPLAVRGDDELALLAESHNRIAADTQRRNAELAALLRAVAEYGPSRGVEALVDQAAADARTIFGLIDSNLSLLPPALVAHEETIPGEKRPVRAEVRAGTEPLGVLTGHLPPTRAWEPADQHLLELFSSEVGVAIRNVELFGRIERQNEQLRELDAAKDEFLRGVSHNLQTPLTSIRAYVEQLRSAALDPETDHRLAIIAEQADRLTRLVRQLLTVTRLEAGVLRPEATVISMTTRVRRAWEALAVTGLGFELHDDARGWLAIADQDQLDQVLWALLDNAVKHGGRGPVEVRVSVDEAVERVRVTIADHGPGVSADDEPKLFTRFGRGSASASGDGTGLGLYVSRELLRKMDGDLWLEPPQTGRGAAFTLVLPGERPDEEE